MTSMDRILQTASFKEPDRIPFILLLTMHGAKELGLSIKEYFSRGENVAEGQIRMQQKYHHDCYYPFFYASLEVEAWGGTVQYSDDGPPLAGPPIIRDPDDILKITAPNIESSSVLAKSLTAIRILKEHSKGEIPIIAVVISPFSIPIMQMGFDRYIDLIHDKPDLFEILMKKNLDFSIRWANAQIQNGADIICYFDPCASSTITQRSLYEKWGKNIASDFIKTIPAPVVTHLASGRGLNVVDLISQTGTIGLGVSTDEKLSHLKKACHNKLTLIGNMNGIEMRTWDKDKTRAVIKDAISQAGRGGGFILSDNHGEIPFQVPDSVLNDISETIMKWGKYPLSWINDDGL